MEDEWILQRPPVWRVHKKQLQKSCREKTVWEVVPTPCEVESWLSQDITHHNKLVLSDNPDAWWHVSTRLGMQLQSLSVDNARRNYTALAPQRCLPRSWSRSLAFALLQNKASSVHPAQELQIQQWRMERQHRRQFSWLPLIRGLLNAQNKAFSSLPMSAGHLTERRATGGRTGRVRGPSCTVCVGLGSKVSPAMSLEAEQHINTFICPSVGRAEKHSWATGLHLAPGNDGV